MVVLGTAENLLKLIEFVMLGKKQSGVMYAQQNIKTCIISSVIFLYIPRVLYCKCFCRSLKILVPKYSAGFSVGGHITMSIACACCIVIFLF